MNISLGIDCWFSPLHVISHIAPAISVGKYKENVYILSVTGKRNICGTGIAILTLHVRIVHHASYINDKDKNDIVVVTLKLLVPMPLL